ncbi:Copia protein, partial [Acromyrmex echinatior]
AGIDNRFWRKAILTATYLQNRMTSRSVSKIPIELFIGEKPNISHIRIFGSKMYSFIHKQRRKKWDNKADKDVLIGYNGNFKAYRI